MSAKRLSLGELAAGVKFPVDASHPITLLGSRRIRLAGMFFDTDKCFPLPIAIPGMKRVVETHTEDPAANILIVGHTDTSGKDDYNAKLSLERAQAVADYLHGKADAWEKHFQDPAAEKRWGAREIQSMLKRLTEDGRPFLPGAPDGKDGPATQAAVRSYQQARGLKVDGIAGPQTRKSLVKDYMALAGANLPADASVTVHGCGEAFPAAEVKDGAKSPQDRRAEILFLEGDIQPKPPGEISKKGSQEYPQWIGGVTETVDVLLSELTAGFDFDLPQQKKLIFEPGPEDSGGGDDEPILVAANDDRLVAQIISEARQQHEKRGKDDFTEADGEFVPFKPANPPKRPDIRMDHGFLDDGKGNLDKGKMREDTFADRLSYLKWETKLEAAELLRPDLLDATNTYRHFLEATGDEFEFDYDRFGGNDKAGKKVIDSAIEDTIAAALELSDKDKKNDFSMQTDPIGVGGFNGRYPYPSTENWQKAIGAHVIWLEAHVKVEIQGDKRFFKIDMKLHAEDRYNFNPGAKDIATGTPDADNGVFEQTGLAKEFDSKAELKRHVEFSASKDPIPDFRKPPGDKKVTVPR
jgi:hypothetical protein